MVATIGAVSLPSASAQSSASVSDEPIVLRIGVSADLTTNNIYASAAGSDWAFFPAEYDYLLKASSEDGSAAPSLATACENNEEFTVWTCTIRSGVLWSDGTPLTAQDVAFSYAFAADNKIPQYRTYFPGKSTFEAPNDTTFVWTFDQPSFIPSIPPPIPIVPTHVWEQYDGAPLKEIRNVSGLNPVVSGPFQLTSWTEGQGWTIERNPNFWGPAPTIDKVEYRAYTNQEAMIQALKNGEVDLVDGLEPGLINSITNVPNITTQKVVSDWWLNLAFNFGGQGSDAHPLPALHDLVVRQAIEMAIDKQAIVDKVYEGAATPGDTIIRQASPQWHLDIPADQEFPFDPAAAADKLEQAGYVDSNGDGIREDPKTGEPLVIRMPASSDTTGAVDSGELIVGFLKQIGIKVNLQSVTDTKLSDLWYSGDFDAYIWYWSGDTDPDFQLSVFTSDQCGGWSDGCWSDPHFDELYQKQHTTMDQAARHDIVAEAQQYEYEQVPGIVLAYPNWLEAYRNDRFTDWVAAPGPNGYLVPAYNYDTLLSVKAVEGASPSGSTSVPGWVWLLVVVVVAGIVVVVVGRGRRGEESDA
jgi:peptide/nickel transport system substrate-binding protein